MVEYSEHFQVEEPIIGLSYHISFARNKGMVWILEKIKGQKAWLRTPKTKKPISCHVCCLRETNKRAELKRNKILFT